MGLQLLRAYLTHKDANERVKRGASGVGIPFNTFLNATPVNLIGFRFIILAIAFPLG